MILNEVTTHPAYNGFRESCQHRMDIEQWVLGQCAFEGVALGPAAAAHHDSPSLGERSKAEMAIWAKSSEFPVDSEIVHLTEQAVGVGYDGIGGPKFVGNELVRLLFCG